MFTVFKSIDLIPVHPEKDWFPVFFILSGNTTEVNPVQPLNALSPIVLTDANSIDVNPVQSLKALLPIVLTDANSTAVNPVQPLNARSPIVLTDAKLTEVNPVQPLNAFVLSADKEFGNVTVDNLAQLENTPSPIDVKPSANCISDKLEQSAKTVLPISFTDGGIVTFAIFV